jgi:hypothetical protein
VRLCPQDRTSAPLGMAITGITQRARPDMTQRFHYVTDLAIVAPAQLWISRDPRHLGRAVLLQAANRSPAGGADDVLGFAE